MRLFLLLSLFSLAVGCADQATTASTNPPPPVVALTISGETAFQHAKSMVEIGPRHSGSPGAEKTVTYLANACRAIGVQPTIDRWQEGSLSFANVYAETDGFGDQYVLIGSHFDTKYLRSAPDFVGANDSASSSGLALSLLQVIHSTPDWGGPPVRFAWFDGEEARVRYTATDGLHGSRRLASTLEATGQLASCRAMILLDMVGDADLGITFARNNDPNLLEHALALAESQGVSKHFGFYSRGTILDDHVPFYERGVPAIDFIDFSFGPNNRYWHTAEDTLDKISPASMAVVGNLVLQLVQELIRE